MVLRERVVVLRPVHGGRSKTIAKLNAPHAGDGKDGMGNLALDTVPEGFSKADRNVLYRALHNSAQGIAIGLCSTKRLRPAVRLLDASHPGKRSMEAGKIEHLFGYGRHRGGR